jgi:NAD(P) transhydrogenase subunit alpha
MILAVPQEIKPGEKRVALVPDAVAKLAKTGPTIHVQAGAGVAAGFPDSLYADAGATVVPDAAALYQAADLVVKVARPTPQEIEMMRPGSAVLAFLAPLGDPEYVQNLAAHNLTALSMDAIPRITRAQPMDALSSQSNIGGYKAVLLAAEALPRLFPMMTTAAGTIPPAKVLILGAGVAGLQAIATARRLGAVVSAYDTRAVVKEQVESLGATFVDISVGEDAEGAGGYAKALSADAETRQREALEKHVAAADVVVTTAQVPGRRAPLLVTEKAVQGMKAGSVIVDMAAGQGGGNCALSEPDKTVEKYGVSIIGATNLPATVPQHASQLYARNITSLLSGLIKDGALNLDFGDEITAEACLTHDGKVLHKPTLAALAKKIGDSA